MGTLSEGAKNAVEVCMAVRKGERVLILTDRETLDVGEALSNAANKVSSGNVKLLVLEDYTQRPAKELPRQIAEAIPSTDVTYYAAQSEPGELTVRGPFIRTAIKYARHGHMPGVTREVMESGMCADYRKISELPTKVDQKVKGCKNAKVTNRFGTDLMIEFHPTWRWKISDGLFPEKGMWGNLPDGEV